MVLGVRGGPGGERWRCGLSQEAGFSLRGIPAEILEPGRYRLSDAAHLQEPFVFCGL